MYNNRFEPINTKLAGVTFEGRQSVCEKLYEGAKILLVREPENIYDSNAIGALFEGQKCGYIPKELAAELAKKIDSGISFEAVVIRLNGGGDLSIGANIRIQEKIEGHATKSKQKKASSEDVRKWIKEEDQPESTEEQAKPAFDLTDEQKEIVAQDLSGNSTMKIIAFAGTGKTATLLEYSKRRPNLRFLYLAFNKSVREEAEKKFPPNVTCKTSHSLAWPEFGAPHDHRLTKNLRLSTVKKTLGLDNYMEAKIVNETLSNFLISADAKFSKKHLPWLSEYETGRPPLYLEMAVKLWIMMCDPNNQDIGMLHDGYLKQYQLSKPELNYDCILLDEAQDTNPVVTDIILSQDCPKILVGDPHQQIYAFRGAQDAMQKIKTDKTFYLTYSFRFGEEIAWIANKILHTFKNEKQSLKGFRPKSNNEEPKDLAIIARTNASVFDQAVAHCENQKIAFLGGIDGYRFNDIIDVYLLYARSNSKISDPFIRSFPTYSAVKAYAEEAEDWEMKSNCKVVEKYQDKIPSLVERIKTSAVGRSNSEVVLTTAHKAKGAQFSKIRLCDDFPDLFTEGRLIDPKAIDPEEFNLLYVTVTRAKDFVDFSSPYEWARFISSNQSRGYKKILDFFGLGEDRIPSTVSEPENDFSHSLEKCDKKVRENTVKDNIKQVNESFGPLDSRSDCERILDAFWIRKTFENRQFSENQSNISSTSIVVPSIDYKMIHINSGTFMMGTELYKEEYWACNETLHAVRLTKNFYMGSTVVTQGQWYTLMKSRPWQGHKDVVEGDGYPAVFVSWDDCQEFILRLNEKENATKFRLPTEAEWEYCCRAGSSSMFSFENSIRGSISDWKTIILDYAQCGYYSHLAKFDLKNAQPVAQKKPNHWGLYDMHGNVWEWCLDNCEWETVCYPNDFKCGGESDSYVFTDTYIEGIIDPLCKEGSSHIIRGGSYYSGPGSCRSADRNGGEMADSGIGFRIIKEC